MSLFRPGAVPAGIPVTSPVWPALAMPTAALVVRPSAEWEPAVPAGPDAESARAAGELIREAQLQAAETLQRAAAEAESAILAARREGYESGRQEGLAVAEGEIALQRQQAKWRLEKAEMQAEAIRQAAEAAAAAAQAEANAEAHTVLMRAREEAASRLEQARREQRGYLDEAQEAVVDLAVAAAVRLVQGHLAIQPAAVVGMVAAGLRRLKEADCTVRITPQDLPLLEAQRSALERELGGSVLTLKADRSLSPGDFTVSSTRGQIDGTIEQQAVHLRTALATALGGT